MAFTEADRVKIRKYLGYAQIFIGSDPSLENAITSCQSIAEGGSRPDGTAETEIKSYLAELALLEQALKDHRGCLDSAQVGNIRTDAVRAMAALRGEGRRYVGYLADAVDTTPRRDVFSPSLAGEGAGLSYAEAARSFR